MNKGKHSKIKNKKVMIIRIISFIIIIICITNIAKWFLENKKNKNLLSDMTNLVKVADIIKIEETEVEKYIIEFEKLKDKNQDVFAWIKVKGTSIEYPIVQSKDNNYYLTHSLDKSYNSAGWIFADYRNKIDGSDKNLVIYGHNRRDGSMFGTLKNILKKEWYDTSENQYITFEREGKTEIYQVFSVYQIEVEDYYIKTNFNDDREFEDFINTIKSRSIKDFKNEVTKADNIITLSTCGNDNRYRVVLHAKKMEI